jgi:hypothetical protein
LVSVPLCFLFCVFFFMNQWMPIPTFCILPPTPIIIIFFFCNSIPFSQLLCFYRLCSGNEGFYLQTTLMLDFFFTGAICTQSLSLNLLSNESFSFPKLNIFYLHPNLPQTHPHKLSCENYQEKLLTNLQNDPSTLDIFPDPPLVAFNVTEETYFP